MNLVFRLIAVVLRAAFGARRAPLDESVVAFRVWPHDLDLNGHMNNGRYLTLMDLGRVDLVARLGVARTLLKRRWNPVVGGLTVRYRRSLAPFQRFAIHTRLLCWDERSFFLEQRFVRRGETAAVALVRGVFLETGGRRVPPAEIVAATGHAMASPPFPDAVRAWMEAEGAMMSEKDHA